MDRLRRASARRGSAILSIKARLDSSRVDLGRSAILGREDPSAHEVIFISIERLLTFLPLSVPMIHGDPNVRARVAGGLGHLMARPSRAQCPTSRLADRVQQGAQLKWESHTQADYL